VHTPHKENISSGSSHGIAPPTQRKNVNGSFIRYWKSWKLNAADSMLSVTARNGFRSGADGYPAESLGPFGCKNNDAVHTCDFRRRPQDRGSIRGTTHVLACGDDASGKCLILVSNGAKSDVAKGREALENIETKREGWLRGVDLNHTTPWKHYKLLGAPLSCEPL